MSKAEKLAHIKHILATGQVPPLKATPNDVPNGEVSEAGASTAQPLRSSSEIAEIPAGYKALKDLEPRCSTGKYALLKEYWPYFISRTGLSVNAKLRNAGVLVDVETLGMGGNSIALQYINSRGPNGRPQILLNVGSDNEYLGRWLDAAAGYNHQSVFERVEIKVIQTTALNLVLPPTATPTR